MPDLPTGTVTFLFTDIEGSTQLLQRLGLRYGGVLAEYRSLLRSNFQAHGGQEVDTQGDSFFVAFPRALDAVLSAVEIQRAVAAHTWPEGVTLATRMGLHTGEPKRGGEGYIGLDVHRAARIGAAGHGGQILLSDATRGIIAHDLSDDVSLCDLGEHRLKDLRHPRQLWQLVIADLPSDFPQLKSLDVRPNNLPLQPTPFIGREREVASIRQGLLQPDVRLVTLTGAGGTGKTRLALQVAADLIDVFDDGVWFVNLEPISDPTLVISTLANVLRVKETGAQTLSAALQAYLHGKRLLLLLDNFEQVVAAAPQIADLLAAAPLVKALVTSRAPLRLRGERDIHLLPLSVPDVQHLPPPEQLTQYDAVRLFIDRAQAVKANFQVTNTMAPAVAGICHRLDGLPLAIELAAARIKLLSPQALLARLERRMQLLTGGAQDLPVRQQTIRATIDWSYELLTRAQQQFFALVSIFVGGWTLEAAEAVCGGSPAFDEDVLDVLQALVDNSLVHQEEGQQGEPRFGMLETIREYALERLVMSGELDGVRRQHATYFVTLVEAARQAREGPEARAWLDRLEGDLDNLRAVVAWGSSPPGDIEHAARLLAGLNHFITARMRMSEVSSWLPRILDRRIELPPRVRVGVLWAAFTVEFHQRDYAATITLAEELEALSQELGDMQELARARSGRGVIARFQGHYEEAARLHQTSLALFRRIGDREGMRGTLLYLGDVALDQGNLAQAEAHYREGLAVAKQLGNTVGVAWALNQLGMVALAAGNPLRAAQLCQESYAIFRSMNNQDGIGGSLLELGRAAHARGDVEQARIFFADSLTTNWNQGDTLWVAYSLAGLGAVAGTTGEPERAARLYGSAQTIREAIGAPIPPVMRAEYDSSLKGAAAEIDDATWNAAWAEGQAMTLEQAIAYALEEMADA